MSRDNIEPRNERRTVKVLTLIPETLRTYIDPYTGYHVVEAEAHEGDDAVTYMFLAENTAELLKALRRVLAALESDAAEAAASQC